MTFTELGARDIEELEHPSQQVADLERAAEHAARKPEQGAMTHGICQGASFCRGQASTAPEP